MKTFINRNENEKNYKLVCKEVKNNNNKKKGKV